MAPRTPENTGCLGPLYWSSLTPSDVQPLVSRAWTREVEAPWRHGRGVALRFGPKLVTFGLWRRGEAPSADILNEGHVDVEVVRSW